MKIVIGIVGALVAIIIFKGILIAQDKQAKVECEKLAEQALTYPNFFYADWQKKMCGIK